MHHNPPDKVMKETAKELGMNPDDVHDIVYWWFVDLKTRMRNPLQFGEGVRIDGTIRFESEYFRIVHHVHDLLLQESDNRSYDIYRACYWMRVALKLEENDPKRAVWRLRQAKKRKVDYTPVEDATLNEVLARHMSRGGRVEPRFMKYYEQLLKDAEDGEHSSR